MPTKKKSPQWDLYPRYAEEPIVTITAKDHASAARRAEALAKKGKVSRGYGPGGSLTPVKKGRL